MLNDFKSAKINFFPVVIESNMLFILFLNQSINFFVKSNLFILKKIFFIVFNFSPVPYRPILKLS